MTVDLFRKSSQIPTTGCATATKYPAVHMKNIKILRKIKMFVTFFVLLYS